MALSRAEVQHVARLARLRLDPDEETRFAAQLGRVVDYIDRIRAAESEAPPATPEPGGLGDAEDLVAAGLDSESVLANAPRAHGPFVVVPRVLAGDD